MIAWFFRKTQQPEILNEKKGGDDFISLASHELRSPLSIIKWYTEILLDGDAGPLTEDQRKYLTTIESSNQRAIDLVRSLLNVSRLDLGTFSISPEEINFHSLIQEVKTMLSKEIEAKHLEFIEEEKSTKSIQADKNLCLAVVKNIIANAVIFSKDGGKIFITTSLVSPNEKVGDTVVKEESVLISVRDTGIGIPEADKPKIFSKMFKASNVKDSDMIGSGLGLYITKSVLEYTSGTISFISTEGVGSTFFVTLPTRGMEKKEGRTTLD